MRPSFYRPQTKFAKVMFLQVSVCPQRGGMCGCSGGVGAYMVALGGGMCGCSGGACMFFLQGGHTQGFFTGGACVVFPGGGLRRIL